VKAHTTVAIASTANTATQRGTPRIPVLSFWVRADYKSTAKMSMRHLAVGT